MMTPYPWQAAQWQQFQQRRQTGQLPHALLFHGPEGIGKQDFAELAARSLLCQQPDSAGRACGTCKPCQLAGSGNHPDFIFVQPEEAGKAIRIDQIRELIRQMSLSPHFGGYRTVLIAQAEQMNPAASNSLLKTLEEPQANSVIFLVTSQLSRLPATIRSRCQMLRFATPDMAATLDWLKGKVDNKEQAEQLLNAANGAPLLARHMAENETIRLRQRILRDLTAIAAGKQQAVSVAAEWLKLAHARPLPWLYHWVCDMIRIKSGGERFVANRDIAAQLQSFAQTIDLTRLYRFLDQLSDAIRFQKTSANELLLLEGLLLSWTYMADNQRGRA